MTIYANMLYYSLGQKGHRTGSNLIHPYVGREAAVRHHNRDSFNIDWLL